MGELSGPLEEEERVKTSLILERLMNDAEPLSTVFRWQVPSGNSSSSSASMFRGALDSLRLLLSPLDGDVVTDEEISQSDDLLRHLIYEDYAVPSAVCGIGGGCVRRLLGTMAHGSVLVCSPTGAITASSFQLQEGRPQLAESTAASSLLKPARLRDFVDGSASIAVFLSEQQLRKQIVEPFAASLQEIKRLRNMAHSKVARRSTLRNTALAYQQWQEEKLVSSGKGGFTGSNTSAGEGSGMAKSEDDLLEEFTRHIFRCADVTDMDIIAYSNDRLRIAEASAHCQRVVPDLVRRDIARRRLEHLARSDEQLAAAADSKARTITLRTEMVLAQREAARERAAQLARGTTALIGAHRFMEHQQRALAEKIAFAAATLPPAHHHRGGVGGGGSSSTATTIASRAVFGSQLLGAVPVHLSRHIQSQDREVKGFGDGNVAGGAAIVKELSASKKLYQEMTVKEQQDVLLKQTLSKLEVTCKAELADADTALLTEHENRVRRRHKINENAAVEQGVVQTLRGKDRTRHRLAIEQASVASLRELLETTSHDLIGKSRNYKPAARATPAPYVTGPFVVQESID